MTELPDVIALRQATPTNAEEILWLEEVCMKAYATALWGSWRASSTVETLDISCHEMITLNGKSIGCIATRLEVDSLSLLKLYLAPKARNHGIGATVLKQVMARAVDLPVRLRVLANNPAVRFYERHGFRTERRTEEHVYMILDANMQSGGHRNEDY